MKLTFLGSSHGVPEPHRRCSCTMLEIRNSIYFIDMGISPIDDLVTLGYPIDSVKGIFITHMHGDHTDGLINFYDLCSWYYLSASPALVMPEPEKFEDLKRWLGYENMRGFDVRKTEAGLTYDDGVLRVTAAPTLHCPNSFAYLVEGDGSKIVFSGDLCHRGPQEDFPLHFLECKPDLVICESAHFSADKYIPLLRGSGAKQVCINHYVKQNIQSVLTLGAEIAPIPVTLANDGMTFNF